MKRDFALWAGILTGPVVWLLSLEAKFAIAPWVCAWHWKPAIYVVSLAAFAIVAFAGWVAWSQWRELSDGPANHMQLGAPQAMAFGGMLLSAGFLIVLIAQALPELLMSGCES